MSANFRMEALLRPIVEGWSAMISFICAFLVFLLRDVLLVPPLLAWLSIIFFGLYGLRRFRQFWRLRYYQKHLTVLPTFTMNRKAVPVSNKRQYLGNGFLWEQKHRQRLEDTRRSENSEYVTPSRLAKWARNYIERTDESTALARFLSSDSFFNPFIPAPPIGGNPALHGVGLYEQEHAQFNPISERVGHTLVLGTTRVGKTRFCEVLVNQDIRRGDTTIVFDPKGDAELLQSMWAAAALAGRLDNFHVIHLAYPEYSSRYNPVGSYTRITEVAGRITNALPSEGNAAAFKEFGWRFTNVIARALQELGEVPTYNLILRHVTDIEQLLKRFSIHYLEKSAVPEWESEVARIRYALTAARDDPNKPRGVPPLTPQERGRDIECVALARSVRNHIEKKVNNVSALDTIAEGLLAAFKYDRTYFDKIVSSLGPLLEKLTTGKVAEIISPNYNDPTDARPLLDWRSVINGNGVVYVGLAALTDVTVASAVGAAMFADLTAVAGELYARGGTPGVPHSKPHAAISVHADEFNELIGPEFIPMLNKAGGAGFQVTAYTQTWADVEARLGSRAKALQVEGNLNTIVCLRVKSEDTARIVTDKLPQVDVAHTMTVSSTSDSSDVTSTTDFSSGYQTRITTEKVALIEPSDLMALPKGQAFALVNGSTPLKLRLPLMPDPTKDPSVSVPDDIKNLTEHMRREYKAGETLMTDHFYNDLINTNTNAPEPALGQGPQIRKPEPATSPSIME